MKILYGKTIINSIVRIIVFCTGFFPLIKLEQIRISNFQCMMYGYSTIDELAQIVYVVLMIIGILIIGAEIK